jgi:hypothetical protein
VRLTARHTRWVLLAAGALLLTYEFMTLGMGQNATISETVWALTVSTPLVPFGSGVLMGHFFFPKGTCVNCGHRPYA